MDSFKFLVGKNKKRKGILSGLIIFIVALLSYLSCFFVDNSDSFKFLSGEYLAYHSFIEVLCVLSSFSIFALGHATYDSLKTKAIILLSITGLGAGILDIGHILSFKNMPDFITPSGANKSIYFWFFARYMNAIGFLVLSSLSYKGLDSKDLPRLRKFVFSGIIVMTVFAFYIILFHESKLPIMFVEGEGLTALKVLLELIILIIYLVSALLLFKKFFAQKSEHMRDETYFWLGLGSLIFSLSCASFLSYSEIDDRFNIIGHIFKLLALSYVLRGVFIECVILPLRLNKELAIKAQTAAKAKISFLANVSHELRTPLGIINGYSELITPKIIDEEGKEWVKAINRNTKQLRLLIDDLLDLVKSDAEEVKINYSRFELDELLKDLEKNFSVEVKKKDLSLILINRCFKNNQVVTDKHRLKQILNNIISNGIKFTNSGHIKIVVFEIGTQVYIEIEDTGLGISDSLKDELFRPFNQVHDTAKINYGGTGLGLALSKSLSQLLDGDLALKNTRIGYGSSFLMNFKNMDGENVELQNTEGKKILSPEDTDFSNTNILVVDDAHENLNLLKYYFRPTNANLILTDNGEDAIKRIAKKDIDIVLMDIQMPKMSGFDTVSHLRERGCILPIIAVTAHALETERIKAFRCGFDDYVSKPVDVNKLFSSIKTYLNLLGAR